MVGGRPIFRQCQNTTGSRAVATTTLAPGRRIAARVHWPDVQIVDEQALLTVADE
ncbi:MAG: hypothetical protein NTY19_38850 [Planctomycetota bacterium]|nr:hypothetical protein [Planctomycetota bacterium]